MTGLELAKRLHESGTGVKHLGALFDALREHRGLSAADARKAMERAGCNATTLRKADNIIDGRDPDFGAVAESGRTDTLPADLFGPPPEPAAKAESKEHHPPTPPAAPPLVVAGVGVGETAADSARTTPGVGKPGVKK